MLNKIILMGRLVADPDVKYLGAKKTPNASFTLPVDRDVKEKDGSRATDFINVVTWGKQADFVSQYFGKGNLAVVVGSLQMRTWETDKGEKRRVYEVIASEIKFGGDKKETSKDTSPKGEPDEEEEDPF